MGVPTQMRTFPSGAIRTGVVCPNAAMATPRTMAPAANQTSNRLIAPIALPHRPGDRTATSPGRPKKVAPGPNRCLQAPRSRRRYPQSPATRVPGPIERTTETRPRR